MKKSTAFNFLLILAAMLGMAFLLYPHVSFWLAARNQSYAIDSYSQDMATLDSETIEREYEKARDYNAKLSGDSIEDPFMPGSGMVMAENYMDVLNIGGMMGYIKIPKINVDLPIYHGTADQTLFKGAGHLEGTSMPIGGKGTHSVITGHTGLDSAKMFTDLGELEFGDEFYLYILDEIHAYKIDNIKIVEPNVTDDLMPIPDKDYATLITCTPYGINSHRLLVRGESVDYTPQEAERRIEQTRAVLSNETLLLITSISSLTILLLLIIIVSLRNRHKARKMQSMKNRSGI